MNLLINNRFKKSRLYLGIAVSLAMSSFSISVKATAFAPLANPVGTAAVQTAAAGNGALLDAIIAQSEAQSIAARSTGAGLLDAIIAVSERRIAQGTLVAAEELATMTSAAEVAQSGGVIDAILGVSSAAMKGGAFLGLLLAPSELGSDDMIADPVTSGETLPLVSLTDFKASSLAEKPNTLPEMVKIKPLPAADVSRRENQIKSIAMVDCPTTLGLNAALCIPGKDYYVSYLDSVHFNEDGESEEYEIRVFGSEFESTFSNIFLDDYSFIYDDLKIVRFDYTNVLRSSFDLHISYTHHYRDFDETKTGYYDFVFYRRSRKMSYWYNIF